ncbi:TOBE domain-containing protein [Pectinatus brassicae]|uniref:Molybdopterin-binding protein n=1 Tax=Pectinatus brassicae TaxID=862415 RepID=A0A840UFV4_9FIRM|nr:TOBE domain-containing protein [Pectinatus brassicae]MBB5335060.1 molybdopterin-binding protein [Pectinatus brassicae]
MKLSARNQLKGTVCAIDAGSVNDVVKIKLASGDIISATITKQSVEELGLVVGKEAYAVVKASSVMVAVE